MSQKKSCVNKDVSCITSLYSGICLTETVPFCATKPYDVFAKMFRKTVSDKVDLDLEAVSSQIDFHCQYKYFIYTRT